jgi:hypothetical protein
MSIRASLSSRCNQKYIQIQFNTVTVVNRFVEHSCRDCAGRRECQSKPCLFVPLPRPLKNSRTLRSPLSRSRGVRTSGDRCDRTCLIFSSRLYCNPTDVQTELARAHAFAQLAAQRSFVQAQLPTERAPYAFPTLSCNSKARTTKYCGYFLFGFFTGLA